MEVVSNRTFTDEEIHVEDNQYVNCTFKGCTLVYSGGTPSFIKTSFFQTRWVFDGPAQNTINLLKALYHGAGEHGQSVVEGTFANIKRGTFPLRPDVTDATDSTT